MKMIAFSKKALTTFLYIGFFLDITSTVLLEAIFNLEEKRKETQENSNKTKPQMAESQSAAGTAITTKVNNEPASDPELERMYFKYKLFYC